MYPGNVFVPPYVVVDFLLLLGIEVALEGKITPNNTFLFTDDEGAEEAETATATNSFVDVA